MKQANPTFVLVHGSGFGGWIWEKLTPSLSNPAIAVDLPGRQGKGNTHTFEEYVQVIVDAIQTAPAAKVIVVGHSIGTELVLEAVGRAPDKVAAIVALGGLVPENGRSYYSLFSLPQRLFLKFISSTSKNGLKPPQGIITKAYASDLDSTAINQVVTRYAYESTAIFAAAIHWSTIPASIVRYYVRFLQDKSGFSPAQQTVMAKRLHAAQVFDLHSGHLGMLSQPRELASILNTIAKDTNIK